MLSPVTPPPSWWPYSNEPPTVQEAFLPPGRLYSKFKSGLKQLVLPLGYFRGRNLGQFIYYMTQEIYWRPEGSTENIFDLFPVGKACLRVVTSHFVLASWVNSRSWTTEVSVSQERWTDRYLGSPASLQGFAAWPVPLPRTLVTILWSVVYSYSRLSLTLTSLKPWEYS